ncbi:hypothetical protein NMG60_11005215 [Bertholletia excelsa]
MPFPWKKAKGSRISQLVADRFQPPNRGGSLVVETGFPTSVVDLVVKNRDRLKKTHKKKKIRSEQATPLDPVPTRPSGLLEPPPVFSAQATRSSYPPDGFATLQPQRCSPDRFAEKTVPVQDGNRRRDFVVDDRGEGTSEEVEINGIFMAILKAFLVVVLVLGARMLVVGITITAFSLLIMEYAGKHSHRLAKPCTDAKNSLVHFFERARDFVVIKRNNLMMEEDGGFECPTIGEKRVFSRSSAFKQGPHSLKDCIREAQFQEPNDNKMESQFGGIQFAGTSPHFESPPHEIQSVKHESDSSIRGDKSIDEDIGRKMAVMHDGSNANDRRTHCGKVKSKIKQMMLKKPKKKQPESKLESSNTIGDRANVIEEKENAEAIQLRELIYDDDISSSSSSGMNGDQIAVEDAIYESPIIKENVGRERGKIWGCLIIFVIVLVGLLGSRALAFGLTLSWCLLLKSAGTLQRYMEKGASISS